MRKITPCLFSGVVMVVLFGGATAAMNFADHIYGAEIPTLAYACSELFLLVGVVLAFVGFWRLCRNLDKFLETLRASARKHETEGSK